MVIANPLYDVVFKRMMENERVARFFIGTLLEQTIESIVVQPQEYTFSDKDGKVALFRLDYIATIKTESGERIKVLIEIQKARDRLDLLRFRNYLGEHYKKEDTIDNKPVILPIITIYVLGYNLQKTKAACFRVGKLWEDLVDKMPISEKDDDIERLTHDCYVVQVERIADRYKSKLDKLLSLFEQTNFVDDKKTIKEYRHEADLEEIKIMTEILHHAGTDPAERKQIENEQEAWRTFKFMYGPENQKLLDALNEKDKALDENKKVINEKDKALDENKKVINEKDKALDENKKVINEKDKALDENKKVINEKDKALDENKKVINEKDKALDEQNKALHEMARQLEELKRKHGEK